MPLSRWVAGLAATITAMLVQATLVGPLLYPLPASLALVLVVSVAVLSGPSAGMSIGFASGLLVDLASAHAFGLLTLSWLATGTAAGMLGGLVVRTESPTRTSRRARRHRRGLRRQQALLVGGLSGIGTAGTEVVRAVLGDGTDSLAPALLRCAPAAVLDAILALAVLPLVAAALRSGSLRAPAPMAGRYESRAAR